VTTSTSRVQLKTSCLMRQNRQSTQIYVVHHNALFDSFRIQIRWFQPKQDSDRIRISFFKNRIGSDSKNPLSNHLWWLGLPPYVPFWPGQSLFKSFVPASPSVNQKSRLGILSNLRVLEHCFVFYQNALFLFFVVSQLSTILQESKIATYSK